VTEELLTFFQEERGRVDGEMSTLARKILRKCNGKTLDSKAIALSCGMAPGGSTIKKAIRELISAGHVTKSGAGLYAVLEIFSAPTP
jgi:hypothetical protein